MKRLLCLLGKHLPTLVIQAQVPHVSSYFTACSRCGHVMKVRL